MAYQGKLYTHEKDENFDAYVESLSIPAENKAKLKTYKPQQKLEKNGDVFTLTSFTPSGEQKLSFKIGEEFEETLIEGHKAKTTFTIDGNTLTQIQSFPDGQVLQIKREYFEDKLIVTLSRSNFDVSAVRYYKA